MPFLKRINFFSQYLIHLENIWGGVWKPNANLSLRFNTCPLPIIDMNPIKFMDIEMQLIICWCATLQLSKPF